MLTHYSEITIIMTGMLVFYRNGLPHGLTLMQATQLTLNRARLLKVPIVCFCAPVNSWFKMRAIKETNRARIKPQIALTDMSRRGQWIPFNAKIKLHPCRRLTASRPPIPSCQLPLAVVVMLLPGVWRRERVSAAQWQRRMLREAERVNGGDNMPSKAPKERN